MNKYIRRIGILIITFVIAGGAFFIANRPKGKPVEFSVMKAPEFPVITMVSEGRELNELHGYAEAMKIISCRDTITPLAADRSLSCNIQTFGQGIEEIRYEIRALDGDHLIQKSEAAAEASEDGQVIIPFSIQNLISMDQEYSMTIILNTKKHGKIYYYTRILWQEKNHITELTDFALDFSSKTFDSVTAKELSTYLEPGPQADNTNLGRVTIHSNLAQIAWGGLAVQRVGDPAVKVTESGDGIADLQLHYQIATEASEDESEIYDIVEAFSLKWTSDRIYVMAYERTMNQIFEVSAKTIQEQRINLGISYGVNLEAAGSKTGDYTAFVVNHSLWSYDKESHQIIQLFTFRDKDDIRSNYGQHDIKVVSVDDGGDVDFIVYGYMNRGIHEGEVGISYYKYNAKEKVLEEKFYIPSEQSYGMLDQDMGTLSYITENQLFYFILNGSIYAIDLTGKEYIAVAEGLNADEFIVSSDNKRIAWIQNDGSSKIHMMNLSSGVKHTITSEPGEVLRVLGFLEDDFVYGIARSEDVNRAEGSIPMYALEILGDDQVVQKRYEVEGIYITTATVLDTRIWMERAAFDGNGALQSVSDDTLVLNKTVTAAKKSGVSKENSAAKKQIYYIGTKTAAGGDKKLSVAVQNKLVESDQSSRIVLPGDKQAKTIFYAYSFGTLKGIYANVSDAINGIYDDMGTITDYNQTIVWARTRKRTYRTLQADPAIQFVEGMTGLEMLAKAYPEKNAISAEGCNLNQALNFVSSGRQVLAAGSLDTFYMVLGYDQFNVTLLNLRDGATSKMGLNDGAAYFASAGNRFYTYIEP